MRLIKLRPKPGDFFAVMYHYVRSPETSNLKYLEVAEFELMLDYLLEEFGIVNREEWENFRNQGIRPKGAILTFDDGLKDHFKFVATALKRRELFGIFYTCTDPLIGKPLVVHQTHYLLAHFNPKQIWEKLLTVSGNLSSEIARDEIASLAYSNHDDPNLVKNIKRVVNWFGDNLGQRQLISDLFLELTGLDNLKFMSDWYLNAEDIKSMSSQGFEIGSHTCSHRLLSRLDANEIRYEIQESQLMLADILSSPIKSFCFPYGGKNSYNSLVLKELKNLKFTDAFSVHESVIKEESLYELSRFDCNAFKTRVNG
jgi:peptidoglycan/xylan/chitin deacetylase (PgdA/CDA1 family)